MKNRFLRAVCLVMALLMVLTGCSKKEEPAQTTATTAPMGDQTYTVEVASEGGKVLSGVEIRVYKDSTLAELQWAGSTDANGVFSFTVPASSTYHVVLKNVPAGYVAADSYPLTGETTRIELKTQLLTGVDISTHKVNLGDVMFDFAITDCEGTSYTLSKLLLEKDAVILNLWFENCGPCKQEFPAFQKAYETYGDRVALLALNPIDGTDASVAAYKAENGLTFPMFSVESGWQDVFGHIAYPTTVVIDRFGTVSMIYTGTIPDEAMVDALFAYFTAEDYTQQTVGDISDLKPQEAPAGSAENPLEFGGVTMFSVTVPAGETVYCDVYKVSGMQFSMIDEHVSVEYEGNTYTPVNGIVGFGVTSPDTYTPVKLAITNTGTEEKTYGVSFSYLPGTMGNPHTLEMGEITLSVAAGNDQGVYYLYRAEKAGTVTVKCQDVTAGVGYGITLYNLSTYTQRNLGDTDGANFVTIEVNPGDELQVIISTLPDDENKYPAADFSLLASFEEKETTTVCAHSNTEIRNAVNATCTQSGYTGDTYCLDCSVTVAGGNKIDATGHDEELRGVKDATCTKEGYSGDGYCKVCGDKISTGVALSTVPHKDGNGDYKCDSCGTATGSCSHSSTELKNKKDATCTESGYTGDTYCKTCGEKVGNGSVVPAPGHGDTELKNKKDATCTESGYTGDTYCTVCTKKLSGGSVIPAAGHQDANSDGKCDSCGTSVALVTYTVTVLNVDGLSTEGLTVMLGSYSAVTNASGVATFTIPEDTYTLSLPNLENFKVYDQPTSLTPNARNGEVSLLTIVPDGYAILQGEFVKILSTGSNSVELKPGELTYFMFRPSKSGTYQFKGSYTLKYYGTNIYFIQDQTGTLDSYATTSFSLNIKDSQLSATYLIGVQAPSGKTSDTIKITRTGDAVYTWEDKEYTPYDGVYTPKQWTFSGGELQYVDITGKTSDYQLVLGADGYYHLGTAEGPVLYLNLTGGAYADCALNVMLTSNRPVVQGYVKDDNGTILSKENYNSLVKKYVDCASQGLYRLTPDLVRILKTQNENWYTYLSSQDSNINSQITWMCNICYIP